MMSKSSFAVLLAVALVGCSTKPDCDGHYHFHSSFPAEWRDAARSGVTKWNAFGLQPVSLVAADEEEQICSFKVVAAGSPEYERLKPKDGSDFGGVSNDYDSSIAFCPDNWGYNPGRFWINGGLDGVENVTMHELGHVHGLGHIDTPHAVMNPHDLDPDNVYTPADRLECERVWACQ